MVERDIPNISRIYMAMSGAIQNRANIPLLIGDEMGVIHGYSVIPPVSIGIPINTNVGDWIGGIFHRSLGYVGLSNRKR